MPRLRFGLVWPPKWRCPSRVFLVNRTSFFRVWGLCWGIFGAEAAWGAAHESIGIVPNEPTWIRPKKWPPRQSMVRRQPACRLTGGGNVMERVDYPETQLRRQADCQRPSETMMGESPNARADKPPMAPEMWVSAPGRKSDNATEYWLNTASNVWHNSNSEH